MKPSQEETFDTDRGSENLKAGAPTEAIGSNERKIMFTRARTGV